MERLSSYTQPIVLDIAVLTDQPNTLRYWFVMRVSHSVASIEIDEQLADIPIGWTVEGSYNGAPAGSLGCLKVNCWAWYLLFRRRGDLK